MRRKLAVSELEALLGTNNRAVRETGGSGGVPVTRRCKSVGGDTGARTCADVFVTDRFASGVARASFVVPEAVEVGSAVGFSRIDFAAVGVACTTTDSSLKVDGGYTWFRILRSWCWERKHQRRKK